MPAKKTTLSLSAIDFQERTEKRRDHDRAARDALAALLDDIEALEESLDNVDNLRLEAEEQLTDIKAALTYEQPDDFDLDVIKAKVKAYDDMMFMLRGDVPQMTLQIFASDPSKYTAEQVLKAYLKSISPKLL